jgi:hypothetical protein
MRDYVFHTHDDRYNVPDVSFVSCADDRRARQLAFDRLHSGNHHLAVEVWANDRLLFVLGELPAGAMPPGRLPPAPGAWLV